MNLIKFVINILIKFLGGKDNALVAAAILSFIVTLFLVLITKRYVFLTKEISETNLKALNLNEETEKRKTTINIIYNFDRDRFFIDYFDTISILYLNNVCENSKGIYKFKYRQRSN